mgnify:CR=1 FL=1
MNGNLTKSIKNNIYMKLYGFYYPKLTTKKQLLTGDTILGEKIDKKLRKFRI